MSDKSSIKNFFNLTNILLMLGSIFLAGGVMSFLYAVPNIKKFPVNIAIYTNAEAKYIPGITKDKEYPAQILDRCSVLSEKSPTYNLVNAKLNAQRYLRSEKPVGNDYLTLRSGMSLFMTQGKNPVTGKIENYHNQPSANGKMPCNDALMLSYIDTTTLNRKTAEPIAGGTKLSGGQEAVQEVTNTYQVDPLPLEDRVGFSYQLPFGVKKDKEYKMYDALSRESSDLKFVDEKKFGKYNTYHFKVTFPAVDLSQIMDGDGNPDLGSIVRKPASWWRIKAPGINPTDTVEMHRFLYQEKDIWVEPRSGKIVDGNDYFYQYYRVPDFTITPKNAASNKAKQFKLLNNFKVTAFKAELIFTQQTIDEQLAAMENGLKELDLLEKKLPWTLTILGLLSISAGLLVNFRQKKD